MTFDRGLVTVAWQGYCPACRAERPGGTTWLQVTWAAVDKGIQPHYSVCHPGKTAPPLQIPTRK